MPQTQTDRRHEIESLHAISEILHCQLDRRTLEVLLNLIESGVHPEALADIILECRANPLIQSSD
jgi:mitotic-spindle organizing protein 1